MMRHRDTHRHKPFGNVVPDIVQFDPRAAEWDEVSYRDVFAAIRPDLDEPSLVLGEWGR